MCDCILCIRKIVLSHIASQTNQLIYTYSPGLVSLMALDSPVPQLVSL